MLVLMMLVLMMLMLMMLVPKMPMLNDKGVCMNRPVVYLKLAETSRQFADP